LVRIVTDQASSLFAEDRFYFALNPANVDSGKLAREGQSPKLDHPANKSEGSTKAQAKLVLNQATAMTKDAIEKTYGYARMAGHPVRRLVERFPDTIWRLGGFPLLLRAVERSRNAVELNKSLEILLLSISNSWRLSEDVETGRGYEMLNFLLCQKIEMFDIGILETLCHAVGIVKHPESSTSQQSALLNPFLFRAILLDFKIWSRTRIEVQLAHLEALGVLLRSSKHRRFNSKRVARMQLSRKLLQRLASLQASSSDGELTEEQNAMLAIELVAMLRSSLVAMFNDVAIRGVTSFIAVHLCTTPTGLYQRQRSVSRAASASDTEQDNDVPTVSVRIDNIAIMVFRMLTELVNERPAFLRKFGSVITARWLRIFVSLTISPRASSLALELMAALVSDDPQYAEQRSATTTEKRMHLWYETIHQAEENKSLRVRRDAIESEMHSAHRWYTQLLPDLQRERAVLATAKERTFELDPIEGPLRMRSKVRELRHFADEEAQRSTSKTFEDSKFSNEAVAEADAGGKYIAPNADDRADRTMTSKDGDRATDVASVDIGERRHASDGIHSADDATILAREDNTAELESHDEKYRRVIRSLDKGDVIEGVENSLRVVFIEYRASLLIFGKRSFYIIDDYFQRPDGELCNVWEAPEEERDSIVMSTLSSSGGSAKQGSASAMSLVQQIEGEHHRTRKWKWSELRLITAKTFLHRKTAIEVSFTDGQTCLLVLADAQKASAVFQTLAGRNRSAANAFQNLCNGVRFAGSEERSTPHGPRQSGGGNFLRLADAMLGRKGIGAITQRWIDRDISNFDYLMCLNIASGRTYQDVTQYPVMPFVLCDYASQSLDLNDPTVFRDLSKPMGAQKTSRMKQFQERYEQLKEMCESEDTDSTKPFHYGTHYSTAATVSGYLVRLRPFDKIVRALQGGMFDLPDRIFSSMGHAFYSAAEGSLGDVRELIPEAFYLPDFLVNKNNFLFGKTQAGVVVDNVELPPWAKGDPRLFIKLHRDALESDHVSAHLHEWIDLVFGYKQRGEAAVKAVNCFHELSYSDGNLDLQAIVSDVERQAVLKTIHMFGVCPGQLFHSEHPARKTSGSSLGRVKRTLSVAHTPWLLVQSIAPLRTLKHSGVHFIYPDSQLGKSYVSPKDYLIMSSMGLSLSLGHLDGSIRFYAKDNMTQVKGIAEQVLAERISCLADGNRSGVSLLGGQADGGNDRATEKTVSRFVVGGVYGSLAVCQVDVSKTYDVAVQHVCRGHRGAITSIDCSPSWSLMVSGSADGTAIIWDDCGAYVQTLKHDAPVHRVRASCGEGGYVATASGMTLSIWSVNGERIASIETGGPYDLISSLAFYEGTAGRSRYEDDQQSICIVFTGHRGKIIGWRCVPDHERVRGNLENHVHDADGVNQVPSRSLWRLEPFHVSEHFDRFLAGSTTNAGMHDEASVLSASPPLITALQFDGDVLLSGDDTGKLYAWCLPGQSVEVSGVGSQCSYCQRKFGVFEKRVQCASCGGQHCAACTYTLAGSPFGAHKYCIDCRDHLSTLVSRTPQTKSPSLT
jgi:WD40 repeat protein